MPEELRVLGTLDTGLLWGNLGVSLLVVVAGAVLVPALSLPDAFLAIVIGCVIGNVMLATAGAMGAQARVPAMVMLRAPLGTRGSYVPTTVNLLQCIGWTVFELLVIATAAAALSDELFGFGAQALWTLVFGGLALVLGLLGPVGVVRRVVRTIGVWTVPLALAYLAWWALGAGGLRAAWDAPGEGGLSVWQGADIVVAVTVSWIPLAADYTRFSRGPRSAFWGTGVGYFVPDLLLLSLGAVLLFTRDVTDAAALPPAVAAGGVAAFLALLALTVAETDEAFANAYSGAVSSQNLFPWIPQRALVVVTTSLGVAGCADDRPALVPGFPAAARLGFRAPVRGAAGRLARRRPSLRRGRHLQSAALAPGDARRLGTRLCRLPVARANRAWLVGRGRRARRSTGMGHRCNDPELRRHRRRRARGGSSHATCRAPRPGSMSVAIIGNLCVDRVAGGAPRAGGPVFYAARAAVLLQADARLAARCASADAEIVLTPLEETGLPLVWQPGRVTTAFSFHYEGERRVMAVEAVGDPWTPEDVDRLGRAGAGRSGLGARRRSPPLRLRDGDAADDRCRRTQPSRRRAGSRPARRDRAARSATARSTPDVLRTVQALKLSEAEARLLAGGVDVAALRSLGVPEVVLTLGSAGSLVVTSDRAEHVAADRVPVSDPTGAGDMYSIGYVTAREAGAEPVEAARQASALVASVLAGRG